MTNFSVPRTVTVAVFSVIAAVAMALPAHAQRPGTYTGAQIEYLFSGSEVKTVGANCDANSVMILYRQLRMAAPHWPSGALFAAGREDSQPRLISWRAEQGPMTPSVGWNGGLDLGGDSGAAAVPYFGRRLANGGGDGGDNGGNGGGGDDYGLDDGEYQWTFKFTADGSLTIHTPARPPYTSAAQAPENGGSKGAGSVWTAPFRPFARPLAATGLAGISVLARVVSSPITTTTKPCLGK